jgi:GH15 family glucan-1,4-alpha-glucosidase
MTGLPKPSYDLWEEKRGVSTFTSAAVYGALVAAADLAKILGKEDRESFYRKTASEVREGIIKHLIDPETGIFLKIIEVVGQEASPRKTADMSSVYGLFSFGVLAPDDPRLEKSFADAVARLSIGKGIGRYEHDRYYAVGDAGNPWFVTTLWYAEYLIARAKDEKDFEKVREIFDWVAAHAFSSGVLSEQISSANGAQLSVSPLMWSHAAYVNAVLNYLDRLAELGISSTGNPAP